MVRESTQKTNTDEEHVNNKNELNNGNDGNIALNINNLIQNIKILSSSKPQKYQYNILDSNKNIQ